MIIQPFTEKPPTNCPKCGGKKIKRIFSTKGDEIGDFRFLPEKCWEFLKCTCQICFHEWAQYPKDFKEEK